MGILLLLFPVYLYMRPAHLLLCRTHNIRGRRRSLPLFFFFPLSHVVKSHRLIPEPQMIGPWPVLSVSGSPLPPSPAPLYLCCLCWCWEICAGYDRVDTGTSTRHGRMQCWLGRCFWHGICGDHGSGRGWLLSPPPPRSVSPGWAQDAKRFAGRVWLKINLANPWHINRLASTVWENQQKREKERHDMKLAGAALLTLQGHQTLLTSRHRDTNLEINIR